MRANAISCPLRRNELASRMALAPRSTRLPSIAPSDLLACVVRRGGYAATADERGVTAGAVRTRLRGRESRLGVRAGPGAEAGGAARHPPGAWRPSPPKCAGRIRCRGAPGRNCRGGADLALSPGALAAQVRDAQILAALARLADSTWSLNWRIWALAARARIGAPATVHSLYALAVGDALVGEGVLVGHRALLAQSLRTGRLVARVGPVLPLTARLRLLRLSPCRADRGRLRSPTGLWPRRAGRGAGKGMVQPPRLERGTPRSTIWCSNQLS